MNEFEKCMKEAFREIGVAPQTGTPAYRACKHTWDTAYKAGMMSAIKTVEERLDNTTVSQFATSRECCVVRAQIEWIEDALKSKCSQL